MRKKLILKEKKGETVDTTTFIYEVADGTEINFESGQYLDLFFPEDKDGHGKPYTISSSPDKNNIEITVKKMGKFSGKLHDMKIGDYIFADGPMGFMTMSEADEPKNKVVFIAAGIGITPFYSMINDLLKEDPKFSIDLFYSNQKLNSIVFYNELSLLSKKYENFNISYFITRDDNIKMESIKNRRMGIKDIKQTLENIDDYNFYICGSIEFVNLFWKELKNEGVDEFNIFTEAFFAG